MAITVRLHTCSIAMCACVAPVRRELVCKPKERGADHGSQVCARIVLQATPFAVRVCQACETEYSASSVIRTSSDMVHLGSVQISGINEIHPKINSKHHIIL